MMRKTGVLAVLVVALAAGSVLLAKGNPFVGTWKLNVGLSKYDPGPAPQSQTRTWSASGKVDVNGINAAGKSSSYGYTVTGDSKVYSTRGAIPNGADKLTSKKTGPNSYEVNFTKAGKHVETAVFTVSKDGKTLTIHAKGATDAGPFDNLQIWEKQ